MNTLIRLSHSRFHVSWREWSLEWTVLPPLGRGVSFSLGPVYGVVFW